METISGSLGSIGIVFLLIAVNAFFVAAEFTLVAIRRSRVEQMAESGSLIGQLLKVAIEKLDVYIATTQLGITAVGLLLGSFGEPHITRLILPGLTALLGRFGTEVAETIGFVIAIAIITFFTIILGELVPKGLSLQRTEQIATLVILPLNVFQRIMSPFVWLLHRSGNMVLRIFGLREAASNSMVGSAEELKLIVEASSKEGVLNQSEGEIISQILDLEETPVRAIMVPRVDMIAISGEASLQDFWKLVQENRYSRIPVYEETVDKIIGIAYARDLLDHNPANLEAIKVSSIAHPVYFVPETMGARELLHEMRRRKTHMAIVVDEFKGTAGLITLEDIVEEIIGEIYDESDEEEEASIKQMGPGVFVLDAATPLQEVSDTLNIDLPQGEYDTLSGFLMDQLGRIPEVGEQVEHLPYTFVIEAADPRGIERVRAERREIPKPEETHEESLTPEEEL